MDGNFVHLHVHSEYSLLDGAGKIPALVAKAAELGMPALALTDHGSMYGAIDFYKAAMAAGIKPIIGCEVYQAPRSRTDREGKKDDSPNHLVLLAENNAGYRNLTKLVSRASLEGFYYRPRVDWELLEEYGEGLIALSGCLAGLIPRLMAEGRFAEAKETAWHYQRIFGQDNFFLEVQDHGLPEQRRLNPLIMDLARECRIPLVATNDIHYVSRDAAHLHEVLLCIQTGKTLEDEDRMVFSGDEFYLKSPGEMADLFPQYPEVLDNTVRIAQRCNVSFEFDKLYLPEYSVPDGYDAAGFLRELCFRGARERYGESPAAITERLEHELNVINKMGFPGYFLIVWDMINFARERDIPVGPGRGSAAGSLVAYALGITDINPLKYDLLFERFLNPERVNMPDIDTDFCFERRGEIITYLQERYGKDQVAQIITFGTMAAKAAIRDAGRAMNIPLSRVDRIAKLVPGELGITLERAVAEGRELKELYERDPEARQLLETAGQLEGTPRHVSTHAAGVVISKGPLTDYLPVQSGGEDVIVTQFPMQTVEEIGLLKMDILGLRTLTVMGETCSLIKETRGVKLNLGQVPLIDEKTYQMLALGESTGVFQLESSGMRTILKELKPNCFEDIIALVALYRPGPLGSGMVDDFIQRKHGKIPILYSHSSLEPILKDTYGVILYQEQVMRIASQMAGFSLGQADLLRRAMGKKKPEILAAQRKNFLEGAIANGVAKDKAGEIFDLIAHFAGYGFNKSHSAAYALVAYQTAYLKTHYPVEFMAALLTSVMENSDKVVVYIEESRRMGIKVLPPDVNESLVNFTVVGDSIRFGLAAVKNVGRGAIENIIKARTRPFQSLQDFCDRVNLRQVNRRVAESLIKAGAFDSLGQNRRHLLAIVDSCVESASRLQQDRARGQLSLFDLGMAEARQAPPAVSAVSELSQGELLKMEREALGLYVSDHPVSPYRKRILRLTACSLDRITQSKDGDQVLAGGVVVALKHTMTRKGESMAYLNLEDRTGSIEVLVFPRLYQKSEGLLQEDQVLLVSGRISKDDQVKLFADNLDHLPESELWLDLDSFPEQDFLRLKGLLCRFPGTVPVFVRLKGKTIVTDRRLWVEPKTELLQKLEDIFGDGKMKLEEFRPAKVN